MTLFRVAVRNVKKNSNDYLMYFISMVFSILIYYTFASLKYDRTIAIAIDSSTKLSSSFLAATVVLGSFSAVFIWYSNLFFTKKRKKEFGIYSLLGVKKRQIGRMFFYENLIMGSIAILIGMLIGTFFSKFFTMILVRVMGYEVDVSFHFSWMQVIETLVVFMAIFFFASFQGYFIIYKNKLVELFKGGQKRDKPPSSNLFLGMISVAMIVGSYIISHTYFFRNPFLGMILTLVLSIMGTYILFRHFLLFALTSLKKNKRFYYRRLNMITTSNLLYRIKSNYRTLATIAILSAVTLTTIGTSYSFYFLNMRAARSLAPMSFTYETVDQQTQNRVINEIEKAGHHITFLDNIGIIDVEAQVEGFKPPVQMTNFGKTKSHASFIRNSSYKKIAEHLGKYEAFNIHENKTVMLMEYYNPQFFPDYTKSKLVTKNGDVHLDIEYLAQKSLIFSRYYYVLFVVQDAIYSELLKVYPEKSLMMIDVENPTETKEISQTLVDMLKGKTEFSYFYKRYSQIVDARGLLVFISGFLGIVFIIATGTIIFFKQLTEAQDDWQRVVILRKIGVSTEEIKMMVKKEMRIIFSTPLIIGIIHAIIAIDVLATLQQVSLTIPIVISFSIYAAIYLFFYYLTVYSYSKIVLKHR